MNTRKIVRTCAALSIIILIGYFYSLEFRRNWTSLQNFEFVINVYSLIISLFLYLLSYLLQTFVWKVCINTHIGRKELNFIQSIVVVNASGLLKYLPGRIWTYTAQLMWLKKYNISKPIILYVNLICMAGSIIVSLYLGLIYLALYTDVMSATAVVVSFAALISCNLAYIAWNSSVMNKVIMAANRLFRREIQPINGSKSLVFFIQCMYTCSWALMGLGGYFLAKGIGLTLLSSGIFALLASMSVSWLIGYLTILSPAGLGIREGVMLVMLNNVVPVQTALLFPILSRIMHLIAEALMGLVALLWGVKYRVFQPGGTPAD